MSDLDLDELAGELADFAPAKKKQATYTPREERIIAGFEDIERFYEEHGRIPQHGEDRDIFERLYAVRLDRLREQEDCRNLLASFDKHGLLTGTAAAEPEAEPDLDDLATELAGLGEAEDITQLRHVRSAEEKQAAEEIANRERCTDFVIFKPLFDAAEHDLASGQRETRRFVRDAGFQKADIVKGQFFILGGQMVYVAEEGEPFRAPNGEVDARLRIIYANGTESNLLRRSLQRALYKDDAGRRITEAQAGPLFGDRAADDEIENGTIYVLRSRSDHPMIAKHRNVIHKIGVTSGSVETRISGAEKSSTYLLAGVDVVATYKIYGVNCQKLEALIHKVFAPAQIDLTLTDRFGQPVKPREWFLAPLAAIDRAVQHIRDGTITHVRYDPGAGDLIDASA